MTDTDLVDFLDRIVAQAAPGEHLEAYGQDETEMSVRARDGEVESLSSARTRGVGIRVISNGRVGYASTSDLRDDVVADTLAEARANATVGTPDEANILAPPAEAAPMPELLDARHPAMPVQDKVEAALGVEAAARSAGDPVKAVETALYADSLVKAAIASTTGVRGAFERSDAFVMVEVVAERDGASTSAFGFDVRRFGGDLDLEATAAEAAERATRLVGGRKPSSARIPVIFDPFVTASFLGVLAGALTAEAVQRGRSLFAGKVSERLGPEHLTLVDDGRHPDGLTAAPWDGEGTPTGRTTLLSAGILQGFLHNLNTATRDGVSSTGNASRSGYRSPPGLRPTNLYLEPGQRSPQDLIAGAGTAFYCQNVMGLHSGANPISGDFSVSAAGVMVRDGQFAEAVREASIAGTIPGILDGIAAVGSDLRFLPMGGGMGGCTLLVDGMTLAGS